MMGIVPTRVMVKKRSDGKFLVVGESVHLIEIDQYGVGSYANRDLFLTVNGKWLNYPYDVCEWSYCNDCFSALEARGYNRMTDISDFPVCFKY